MPDNEQPSSPSPDNEAFATILKDPHHSRADLQLLRRAVREGWLKNPEQLEAAERILANAPARQPRRPR